MRRSFPIRVLQLFVGLIGFGVGVWLCLQSRIGVGPWDVLAGGLSKRSGMSFGTVVILIGLVIVVGTSMAGVMPGFGTVANMVVIGLVIDWLLARTWLDRQGHGPIAVRVALVLGGVVTVGFASALYIGAHLGSGPRDGLMVVVHKRLGWSIRKARTVLELAVLAVGVVLGGPVGIGTVIFALGIGPAVQLAFLVLRQTPDRPVSAS